MKSNLENIIAITIVASILWIIGSSEFQDANAYTCAQESIAVCSQPH
jgi:hypothetical protein